MIGRHRSALMGSLSLVWPAFALAAAAGGLPAGGLSDAEGSEARHVDRLRPRTKLFLRLCSGLLGLEPDDRALEGLGEAM